MSERYELSAVIVADDGLEKETVAAYFDQALANLEEVDGFHRAFIAADGIDSTEGERLLEMLSLVDDESLDDAASMAENISTDE